MKENTENSNKEKCLVEVEVDEWLASKVRKLQEAEKINESQVLLFLSKGV